jgi:hypothetical protein
MQKKQDRCLRSHRASLLNPAFSSSEQEVPMFPKPGQQ